MKKIWVPKSCLENLPVNVVMTPPGKKTNPRPNASYRPTATYEHSTHLSHPNANVLQGNHTQTYEYERFSSNRYVHKTKNFSDYSYEYHSPPARLLSWAPKSKFSDAALRLIAGKGLQPEIKGVRCLCWGPKTSCGTQDKMPKWSHYVFCSWIACQSSYQS